MKTSLLTGPLLDYWVGMAWLSNPAHLPPGDRAFLTTGDAAFIGITDKGQGVHCYVLRAPSGGRSVLTPFEPSNDWNLAGPVLAYLVSQGFDLSHIPKGALCRNFADVTEYGDTALQAICRAMVAKRFGETVQEYPD